MNHSKTSNPGSSMVSSSDHLKLEEHQVCGSKLCPSCGHKLEGKPVSVEKPIRYSIHVFLLLFNDY